MFSSCCYVAVARTEFAQRRRDLELKNARALALSEPVIELAPPWNPSHKEEMDALSSGGRLARRDEGA
jgi:hypothetical protein